MWSSPHHRPWSGGMVRCRHESHTYGVEWDAERADFLVDGEVVRSCPGPPSYPMQLMLAVFDFPERSSGDDAEGVPALIGDHLRGYER
ncbi:MAG: family 16 glycosylhydrolase [Nocardioidaceae bacterium]